ncbi:phosphoadenosine phosphosulfate reductase family protein [Dolichospermum sp. ST_sed1]|nr:phosphoadenosine phosphosulfate reductase family protein [Dolichospermum sp. ST_sed1]
MEINDLFNYSKVNKSIEVLQHFEPEKGYYLAFSGGKDSQCIYHLAKEAGVKFDAHYNLTTVDPPELVWFIRNNYPDVIIHRPEKTMWQLIIEKKSPPLRMSRYCCAELKELGGKGRVVITGVRWAESVRRKSNRALIEAETNQGMRVRYNQDNEESRKQLEICPTKGQHILNPIINWTDAEVWEFLDSNNIEHCVLYDLGWERIGCLGCPMNRKAGEDLEKYPKIKAQYIRTFQKMYDKRIESGLTCSKWTSGQNVYDLWVGNNKKQQIHVELF